ncbi:ABC transporter ATP-binding protein [Aestuariimicrobium sp. T2.26MG-19.2B]|uniref:ABC transporter ATP-binding protein n=1 Tax=Aestuariimicrobium sp. T2.26MG-19.2B TaxID=3040679 RepID=UPI0024775A8A|nr:ABC transporter ATP-binding protein [Aestuariimicrobium sp. T2.26MG-19.2B]CAI9405155.1 Putative HMP/thiamine import ATP-binding protein YkoD [Aestuariimicrobium sp. T2.26MG-19.2B]
MSALIEARGFGWRHAARRTWAVRDLTFTIEAGERVLLLGPSGSGKSTVLRALAGVLGDSDDGESAGQLLIDGRHPTRTIGHQALVQQDPDSQIVLARVGDDVAFGCENLRVPAEQIWPRVDDALVRVGLDVGRDHPTAHLSGGQKQRLALAGAIAMRSDIVLLDEPTANLDPAGVDEVVDAVAALVADRHRTLVVVEHRVEAWAGLVDRVIVLSSEGTVLADGPIGRVLADQRRSLLAAGVWVPGVPVDVDPLDHDRPASGPAPLLADDLVIGRDTALREPMTVAVERLSTVVTGPNGVGKSTLALTLAGLLRPISGSVRADPQLRGSLSPDPLRWKSRQLAGRIGYVFQEPEHMFVTSTVREELALAATTGAEVDELLARLHLDHLAAANPFSLSGGEKRRLSVGVVLGARPQVIMVDEPTFGQDRTTWHDLVRLLMGLAHDGHALVQVTHDQPFIDVMGQRRIDLRNRERVSAP